MTGPQTDARTQRAWAAFLERAAATGYRVVEPAWLGSKMRHQVICPGGHGLALRPAGLGRYENLCAKCYHANRSSAAETLFRSRVAELGGQVTEPGWRGVNQPHRVICKDGHECAPYPSSLRDGQGICRTCAGNDPAVAEAEFRSRVAVLGGIVTEPNWLGSNTAHRVTCPEGHAVRPYPSSVRTGGGLCRVCTGRDSDSAWQAFCGRVTALGGVVLEPKWLGSGTPHRVICRDGHTARPRPGNIQSGEGICRACAGTDPAGAEAAFRARVEKLGGRVVEPKWLGNRRRHRVICPEGHPCAPWPGNLGKGYRLCDRCDRARDLFYVVGNPEAGRVKLGITWGEGKRRLGEHRQDGYVQVIRSRRATEAEELEGAVLATLRLAGIRPVRGREHFDLTALAVILDVVDHWDGAAA